MAARVPGVSAGADGGDLSSGESSSSGPSLSPLAATTIQGRNSQAGGIAAKLPGGSEFRESSGDQSNKLRGSATLTSPVPLPPRPPIIVSKTGFLTKRSISSMEAFANWKRRFFILANGELSYYKQNSGIFTSAQKESLAHLKGDLRLSVDTVVRKCQIDGKCNCFEVKTATKTLFAQADTAQEAEEWIEALRSHVTSMRRATQADNRSPTGYSDKAEGPPQSPTLWPNTSGPSKRKSATLNLREVKAKQYQLWDAVEEGDRQTVSSLLDEAIVDVNGKGVDQWTALHIAASKGDADMIDLLLDRGAMINAKSRDKKSPLHLAAKSGSVAAADVLTLRGANPNSQDQGGNTALHFAAEGGKIEVVKLLLARDGRVDILNSTGSLPIHFAPIGHPIRVLLSIRVGSGAEMATKLAGKNENVVVRKDDELGKLFFNRYRPDMALGPRDFEFIRLLGRGAFAKVYLVRGKGSNSDKWFAMKAYNKHAVLSKNQARYILTEKNTLQACVDHPFIVKLHYAFQTEDRLFFVMDYCPGGDLLSHLSKKKTFPEEVARFYVAEIILALECLHSKGIVFRDLKPENVVIDWEGHALLTDFGISKDGVSDHTTANTFCGSPMYLAPEMLQKKGHGYTLDWYSVGALLYEMLTGLPPYYNHDKQKLFHSILHAKLGMPSHLSPAAQSLAGRLLERDPANRLGVNGAQEIKQHEFFAGFDWKGLFDRRLPAPFAADVSSSPDLRKSGKGPEQISDQEKGMFTSTTFYPNSSRDKVFRDFDYQAPAELDHAAIRLLQEVALDSGPVRRHSATRGNPPVHENHQHVVVTSSVHLNQAAPRQSPTERHRVSIKTQEVFSQQGDQHPGKLPGSDPSRDISASHRSENDSRERGTASKGRSQPGSSPSASLVNGSHESSYARSPLAMQSLNPLQNILSIAHETSIDVTSTPPDPAISAEEPIAAETHQLVVIGSSPTAPTAGAIDTSSRPQASNAHSTSAGDSLSSEQYRLAVHSSTTAATNQATVQITETVHFHTGGESVTELETGRQIIAPQAEIAEERPSRTLRRSEISL